MQSLCEYCEVIPLNSAELRSRKDDAAASWFGLGHLDRVINSKCPFCRLVTQAIHQDYIANPEDGVATSRLDPVNVVWSNDLGPGKRGAFYVYGVRKCIIYFAGDETQTTDGGDDDGFLRSSISPDLDYHRIGQWISSCEATHTVHCGDGYTPKQFSDAYPGLEVLRLIDVESYCLVRVQDVRRYVALSYVWGGVASVRLATSNLEQMLRINGIKAAWSRLPKTITDTILLAQKLQIRYVWVDALCLIQDDEDDLRRGINVMDNIYERAHLTVVAAYGHNANAGLPGIAKNSRMRTESIDVRKNIHMRVFMELDGMLDSTVYQTRGWTFQEQVLSRRALFFFQNEIFFRCQRIDVSERCFDREVHSIANVEADSWHQPRALKQALHLADPRRDYSHILESYTARSFTNSQDVMRALAGIIRRVGEKMGQEMIQGMPSGALALFLLFRSATGGGFLRRRTAFPSWSWAGWEGQVTFEYDNMFSSWSSTRLWILWHVTTASGETEQLPNHIRSDGRYLRYASVASSTDDDNMARFCCRYNIDTSRRIPEQEVNATTMNYPLLRFWTLAVYYRIKVLDTFGGDCTFYGENGLEFGSLRVDGLESMDFNNSGSPSEVILLSEYTEDEASDDNTVFYNVMLLKKDAMFTQRRGLGHLSLSYIDHSFQPGPVWKEISLA